MRITLREEPLLKSTVYTLICLVLMLFSYSFLPALRIFEHTPTLLVAVISSLALYEGVRYASFFALVFSVLETLILDTNTLIFPLFYIAFAIVCTILFESFFVKNFFAWLCYTAAGLLIHALLGLFAPVANWGEAASALAGESTLPAFAMSVILSLPLYPLLGFVKKKTDK